MQVTPVGIGLAETGSGLDRWKRDQSMLFLKTPSHSFSLCIAYCISSIISRTPISRCEQYCFDIFTSVVIHTKS